MAGFRLVKFKAGEEIAQDQGKASTQYTKGQLLIYNTTTSLLEAVAAQDAKPVGVFIGMIPDKSVLRPVTEDLTTVLCEQLQYVPVAITSGGRQEFEVDIPSSGTDSPGINGVATIAGGSTTTAVATTATSDNDYDGGALYFVERDIQVKVTDSQDTAGDCTFTFEPALSSAVAVGETIRAIPFNIGDSPKLSSSAPSLRISLAVADKSGGNLIITGVDLKNYKLRCVFKDQ